jgi:ABC-type transport system involved in cytochrome c biogenesis permease subunit
MLAGIGIIGFGIWIAILSMAISAFFCRHATEEDVTLVFVAIMDFIVIGVVTRTILRMCRKQQG